MTDRSHAELSDLLQSSRILIEHGLTDVWYGPKGANHHDLIVVSKPGWKLARSDAACGYEGVYVHFEYERPGALLLHCELYPRQGSEAKHPRDRIQPLLTLKAGIADLVRQSASDQGWATTVGWRDSGKDLGDPRALQVGKFEFPGTANTPAAVARAIENVAATASPAIDPIMMER